jgi:integral membrane protein
MPLHYIWDRPEASAVVSPVHGFLFMVYLLAALDLAVKAKWPLWTTVGLVLSGAVPFLSFYMERRVTTQVEARLAQRAGVSAG